MNDSPVMDSAAQRGPSNSELLAAIAMLRWNLLVNSLQTIRGRLELVSRLFVGLAMAAVIFGGAFGLTAISYFAVARGEAELLAISLWVVFLSWQIFPFLASMSSAPFEFSSLLRFPIRFTAYFGLSLAYSIFDPAAIAGWIWLAGMVLGIAFADASLALWALPLLILFGMLNLLCSRAIFVWLERWLAMRRTRELLSVLFILFIIGTQFIGPIASHLRGTQLPGAAEWTSLLNIERISPPGLAALSLEDAQEGRSLPALLGIAGLLAYTVIFTTLLRARLHAQFQGENLSESRAAVIVRTRTIVRPGWNLRGLSSPISAIFEKECRYLLRSGPTIFTLIMPLVFLVLIRFLPGRSGEELGPFGRIPDFVFPAGAAYALIVLTNLAYNNYGADGAGVQAYLMGPISFRDVLLAKNLTHTAVLTLDLGLVLFGTILFYRPPTTSIFFGTLGALLFALPLNFAVGNLMSVFSPKKIDMSAFGRQRASVATSFASMGVFSVIIGISALVFVVTHLLGRDWLAGIIFLPFAAGAFALYWWLLGRTAQLAQNRREVLVAEICRA